jgi:DNA-binding transcriptional regulator LsrR (DeoR family)
MVIGIAGMSHKAPAIAGALSSGLLIVIITDEATGLKVLANTKNESIK